MEEAQHSQSVALQVEASLKWLSRWRAAWFACSFVRQGAKNLSKASPLLQAVMAQII